MNFSTKSTKMSSMLSEAAMKALLFTILVSLATAYECYYEMEPACIGGWTPYSDDVTPEAMEAAREIQRGRQITHQDRRLFEEVKQRNKLRHMGEMELQLFVIGLAQQAVRGGGQQAAAKQQDAVIQQIAHRTPDVDGFQVRKLPTKQREGSSEAFDPNPDNGWNAAVRGDDTAANRASAEKIIRAYLENKDVRKMRYMRTITTAQGRQEIATFEIGYYHDDGWFGEGYYQMRVDRTGQVDTRRRRPIKFQGKHFFDHEQRTPPPAFALRGGPAHVVGSLYKDKTGSTRPTQAGGSWRTTWSRSAEDDQRYQHFQQPVAAVAHTFQVGDRVTIKDANEAWWDGSVRYLNADGTYRVALDESVGGRVYDTTYAINMKLAVAAGYQCFQQPAPAPISIAQATPAAEPSERRLVVSGADDPLFNTRYTWHQRTRGGRGSWLGPLDAHEQRAELLEAPISGGPKKGHPSYYLARRGKDRHDGDDWATYIYGCETGFGRPLGPAWDPALSVTCKHPGMWKRRDGGYTESVAITIQAEAPQRLIEPVAFIDHQQEVGLSHIGERVTLQVMGCPTDSLNGNYVWSSSRQVYVCCAHGRCLDNGQNTIRRCGPWDMDGHWSVEGPGTPTYTRKVRHDNVYPCSFTVDAVNGEGWSSNQRRFVNEAKDMRITTVPLCEEPPRPDAHGFYPDGHYHQRYDDFEIGH